MSWRSGPHAAGHKPVKDVFLYGPMAWKLLADAVSGHDISLEPATLEGHGLSASGRFGFPTLYAGGGQVRGAVLTGENGAALPVDARNCVTYFAQGLGYGAVTRDITFQGQRREATIFMPSQTDTGLSNDWRFEVWEDAWGTIALNMAEEVGQHFGVVPASVLSWMMPMIQVRAAAREAANTSAPTRVRSDIAADRVEIEAQTNAHAGFFLTRSYTLRHPTFDGGTSPSVNREVFVATDAAIVLPYDPVRDRVLLVEQFRMGPFGRGDPFPWMLEPVAGRVDPGEKPSETARRECIEEAGLDLRKLLHISSHYCSPGCSTEYFNCYVGLCDLPDLSTGQGGLDTEHEDIRTHVLSYEDAMALIPSGEAANGPLVLCLLWLSQVRDGLRGGA